MEPSCVRKVTDHQTEPWISQGIAVSFVSQTINRPGHASMLAKIQVSLKARSEQRIQSAEGEKQKGACSFRAQSSLKGWGAVVLWFFL